ncbi:MAG: U32 family peptidase [Oscillospiraceae bacterium]|nr:U32 family peptidase [Oscillospiraceae bacterium]MBR3610794.1 U32 family peptidase [Oscillospiraceae bacterium]MBR3952625.1 U32 family peptidase [Oscillospiraceae bacterium]
MKRPELLAPAGDMECLETAVHFGADAVYIGGPLLQLRADNVGFDREGIAEAVKYAHEHGVKLYVTVNCFAKNEEIDAAGEYAKYLHSVGVDAIIVSDIGLIAAIREAEPELEIHVSTQANCQNFSSAKVYWNMGAKRVVLGREMTLDEIIEFRKRIPEEMEIEAFVHGAMCMAYSGRCMISSYLVNRSGNRGGCAQPCRWNYHLVEMKRPNEFFQVEEDEKGTAILSSHDMCAVTFLDKLEAAGISSYKIEGRMKTPFYVATAVNAYRHAIDGDVPMEVIERELDSISHRPYSSAFYFGEMKMSHGNSGAYIQKCTFVGKVLDWKDGFVTIEQRNNFKPGDELEVIAPESIGEKFTVTAIFDEEGNEREDARLIKQILRLPCPIKLQKGDLLRKRIEE